MVDAQPDGPRLALPRWPLALQSFRPQDSATEFGSRGDMGAGATHDYPAGDMRAGPESVHVGPNDNIGAGRWLLASKTGLRKSLSLGRLRSCRRRHPATGSRSASACGTGCRALQWGTGERLRIDLIRSLCSRRQTPSEYLSWCRSATAGCCRRRSPSSGVRPQSWRPIWRRRPLPASGCRRAATATC